MPRFNYIVTIHNREDLIERVLNAILICAGDDSHIFLVLDGCTDRTEAIVDHVLLDWVGLPVTKVHAPNVHETRSLNIALKSISQAGDGYNLLIQDDIILQDRELEKKIVALYKYFGPKIGVVSLRHGANIALDTSKGEIAEVDLIESVYGQGLVDTPLEPDCAAVRMVCMRSPQCISFETVRAIGFLDEKFAPYSYDDYDYCLRCIARGLQNIVYALKTSSRVEWGGMRRSPQPGVASIMKRNRQYIYQDHAELIRTLKLKDYELPAARIPVDAATEDSTIAMRSYLDQKSRLKQFVQRRRFDVIRRLREKFSI